ncbi:MAG: hypothetical protein JXQ29_16760 [Planctomycetes bacterium]|nr:hypothetical protein [Planctomycetota bacterium]
MTIEQRLERLEKENRWIRMTAVAVALALGAVLFVAAGQDQEKDKPTVLDQVRAKSYILVDAENRVRGQWYCRGNHSAFRLDDGLGKGTIGLDLGDEAAGMCLSYGRAGMISLTAYREGGGTVMLTGQDVNGGIQIAYPQGRAPLSVHIWDRKHLRAKLTVPEGEPVSMEWFDQDGRRIEAPTPK